MSIDTLDLGELRGDSSAFATPRGFARLLRRARAVQCGGRTYVRAGTDDGRHFFTDLARVIKVEVGTRGQTYVRKHTRQEDGDFAWRREWKVRLSFDLRNQS